MSVETICRDCVFAVWDDGVQTDCEFNRLRKFADEGVVITKESDEFLSYFRIHRYCTAVHNQDWADAQEDQTPAGLRIAAYEEFKFKPLAVIYASPDDSDEDVERSIASLLVQDPPIAHLTLCFYEEYDRASRFAMKFAMNPPSYSWDVIQGASPSDEQLATYGDDPYLRLVDEAVLKNTCLHYTAGRAGFEWPENLFDRFDTAKNSDMKEIVGIFPAPECDSGFISLVVFHKLAGENRVKPIYEKFVEAIEEQGIDENFGKFEDFI